MRALLAMAAVLTAAAPVAPATPYLSLTRQFADFADRTAAMPDDARIAAFGREIAPLFPDFYVPQQSEAADRYRGRVLDALKGFPAIRARYEAAEAAFPAAFTAGIAHFKQAFPDFRPPDAIVFLHSMGELDGGTRTFRKRLYLLFGADVIARYHDPDSIGALFDHELFHVEHARSFADCQPVWCGLWQEGLAVYAAATMNPGASDRILLLEAPKPIRGPTDAHWRDALCLLAAKRNSTAQADYGLFFFANANGTVFPSRFGYYLGYRLAERAGKTHSLQEMAHFDHAHAHTLVEATLAEMIAEAGGCAANG